LSETTYGKPILPFLKKNSHIHNIQIVFFVFYLFWWSASHRNTKERKQKIYIEAANISSHHQCSLVCGSFYPRWAHSLFSCFPFSDYFLISSFNIIIISLSGSVPITLFFSFFLFHLITSKITLDCLKRVSVIDTFSLFPFANLKAYQKK